jgi:hypothetical protein
LQIRDTRNRFALGLILIALVSAIPRLVLGSSQYIEYDGYWHIFIAQQDNWSRFWEDIRANAHPPLYFLLLKAVIYFHRSLLAYRAISLVTGVGSVLVLGSIARKITRSNLWAWLAALAYGLALPGIIISNEVRSYMLSAFLVLLSFSWLLDLAAEEPRAEGWRRAGFALAAILASLSHYYAFFYSGAAILLLAARFLARKFRGQRVSWLAETATIAPVLGVIAALYGIHAGSLAQIQGHLLPYYYDPAGHESIPAFLIRNWNNLVNWFLPYAISSKTVALVLFAAALAGGIAVARGFFHADDNAAVRASWALLVTGAMLGAIAVTAVGGKYPFGGDLRQQFLLFPFFVLCAAVFADRAATRIPTQAQWAVTAAVALAIAGISTAWFIDYPKDSGTLLKEPMDVFDRVEPAPVAVYVDQFNLITFFIYHDDWRWTSVEPSRLIPGIDVYRVTKGARQMLVFRDKTEWNVKPGEAPIYAKLAECLRDGKTPEISVFSALQTPPEQPFSNLKLMRRTIASLASDSSVCAQRLTLKSDGWYGTFRASDCTATDLKAPRKTGTFDDTSDEIEYTGAWTHASFTNAAGGTVSFASEPAAGARLEFRGTEITWVYTKAFNRGIASVKIDGVPREDIDLYSPTIVWQSRTTFGGLAAATHTFELTVTGRKDAPATGRFVDLDALVVP